MRIHADPTTDGTGIALDVDSIECEVLIMPCDGASFAPSTLVLTPDEAAELRDELTRALDKIAPKTRTPADVLTDPQPGDRVEVPETDDFESSTLIVISVTADDVEFSRSSVVRCRRKAWAEPRDEEGNAYVCVPASDVPPPAA